MRLHDPRGRQSEQEPQVHGAVRVADQLVQRADIHHHLVLVHARAVLEHSRDVRVDIALGAEQGQQVDFQARLSHQPVDQGAPESPQALP